MTIAGNQDLTEQSLDAFEVGYSGVVLNGRAILSAAVYRHWAKNEILFTEDRTGRYTATQQPSNWPLPPPLFAALIASGRVFPGRFTYENFGKSTTEGIELGINAVVSRYLTAFGELLDQTDPDPNFALSELNLPPDNRFNIGATLAYERHLAALSVSYTDDAFWQDVLSDAYHGTTDAYTMVNFSGGVRWGRDRVTTSVKIVNLANSRVQQHVFGDLAGRQIVAEFKVNFPRR